MQICGFDAVEIIFWSKIEIFRFGKQVWNLEAFGGSIETVLICTKQY